MRLILSFVLSLLALPATAQCVGENLLKTMSDQDRATLDAAVAANPYPEGNLWLATKGNTSIHILGTMHLNDARLDPYLEPFWEIADNTDLILLEGTRETLEQQKQRMVKDPSVMFITDGPTLPERLPEDEWQALVKELSTRGIPGFMASKMQPWYVSLMLSIPPYALAGMAEQNGVDHRIMDYADRHNIPSRALEPYDTVFSLFGDDTPEQELDGIRLALAGAKNGDAMISTLIETYLSGQHRAIWELNRYQMRHDSGLSEAEADKLVAQMEGPMLNDRNANWMEVILPAAAATDNIIVAVGAAHLSGEKGLLYLLEQSGYTLTRVDGF
jgi:uncharacterized protein YbaP (TraB family)